MIYRQAAINAIIEDKICDDSLKIMTALGEGDKAETLNMACDRHAKMLMNLPPASPELNTGYWVDNGDYMYCSKCYMRLTKKTLFKISLLGKSTPNYCPGCGVDMRGK